MAEQLPPFPEIQITYLSSTLNMQAADYSEKQPLATGCHHPKTGSPSL